MTQPAATSAATEMLVATRPRHMRMSLITIARPTPDEIEGTAAPLTTAHLLDCQGRTTHTLTLEIDGTVTVTFRHGGHSARIDPRTRTVLTPGMVVPDALLDEAAALRP